MQFAHRIRTTLCCAALLLFCFWGYSSCGGGETGDQAVSDTEDLLVRERVAHWFSARKLEQARSELAPLVARDTARTGDLIRAAAVEFGLSEPARAEVFLARAEEQAPNDPALHFLRGQMAREGGEYEAAVVHLRKAHELAPDDLPTRYVLGVVLGDLDNFEEAEGLLRGLVEVGIENGGSWYVSALYRLERLLIYDERPDEAEALRGRRQELQDAGYTAVDAGASRIGSFGRIAPPEPQGTIVPAPPTSLTFEKKAIELPSFAGALMLHATDLDGDGRADLLARTATGVASAVLGFDGWEELAMVPGASSFLRAFDLDNEPDSALELMVVAEGELRFYRLDDDGAWAAIEVSTPALPGVLLDVQPVDFDHEGDIDLLLVGEFGARLWRNDGAWLKDAPLKGEYVDASEVASMPSSTAVSWAITEDFDGDNDVDLLMGSASHLYLADSLRAGKFADVSSRFAGAGGYEVAPSLADVNGDGRPDVMALGAGATLALQSEDFSFGAPIPLGEIDADALAVDLDLDGAVDLVWGAQAILAVGLDVQARAVFNGLGAGLGPQCLLDANSDGALDIVRVTATGLDLFVASGIRGNSMPIVVRGNKSNKRGMGSIVELRSGEIYRRVYYRGETLLVGVGQAKKIDVLRITYPNGGVLSKLDVSLESGELIDDPSAALGEFSEPENIVGSCPFLYTWNGEQYVFVTDVLGITPLGLPMAPGMMVPPDHDEFVLVTGEQLKSEGGIYKLQITEELREVTYLDRLRLDVVDHPLGTEVFPNELFKFPPFPEEHLHSVEAPSALRRATGSDGEDWTEALALQDEVHALPFQNQLPQFQGLAKPWFLDLEFDPAAIANAKQLRLVMTGWFFWSDASANMAAARTPGVDFIPPMILMPDGKGGWRETGPPIGFPAGKTKTMVVDLAGLGLEKTPRLRLACSLQLYWDRIVLATDGDDAERLVTSLEATTAQLSRRGFSASVAICKIGNPERFEFGTIAPQPRWNPHPGMYTKLGECLPLLSAVDDQYIILAAGDALEVHFDATQVPPLAAGWRRDYLLYLDGWAKDRDHNTLEALEVEPLPFHGMSGYPYGPDEQFPTDGAHQAWRAEWNTRPAEDWIKPLATDR